MMLIVRAHEGCNAQVELFAARDSEMIICLGPVVCSSCSTVSQVGVTMAVFD